MPVYSVDIPGSGSYDVESDKELTDAQAYQYALIQANQAKAHEAKTGFKPAMSSAFQKALGSADVGIAGILGGIESSEATDKKYRTGIEKNLEALNALQGLKRATANDLMDAINTERQIRETADWHKGSLDINRQKLPLELAEMQSKIGENDANAQRLRNLGTGASKQMTENQQANLQKSAMAYALKELSGTNEFGLMSSEDQQTAVMNRAKEIFAAYMGGANTTTPPPASTADKFPGYNDLTGK